MVRYRYTSFPNPHRPPAPFVRVLVGDPTDPSNRIEWAAQLDPGADRTVVPDRVLAALSLPAFDSTAVEAFGGTRYAVATYMVTIAIMSLRTHVLEVTEGRGEDYVLLGRDVLNQHKLLLDGPSLRLEIE